MKRSYDEIKNLVTLTPTEISLLKHALGITTRIGSPYYPYRNHFFAGKNDYLTWEHLKFWGLAEEISPNWYKVTRNGKKLLSEYIGIRIEEDLE